LSSILKALKKLEKEHSQTGDHVSLPQKLGTKKNISRTEITSGRFTGLLWTVLTVTILCAVAGVIFYVMQPSETETVSTPAPDKSVQSTAKKPVRSKPSAYVKRPVRRQPPQKKTRPSTASKTPAGPSSESVARPSTKKKPDRQASTKAAVRQPPVRRKASPRTDLPELKTGLTLQAISWSEESQRRIAVINGNILREGGAVEDFTITRIDQNQVVVRKGSEEWKLLFKLK
jgi:cytoskeletal protein RodZ